MSDSPSKVDAESLSLRARPRPVTRLNRRALIIGGAILSVVVLAAVLWALRPPAARQTAAPDRPAVVRVPRAEGLATLPTDYSQVPKLGPPLGELGRPILQLEQQAEAPAVPERSSFVHDPEEDAARAARLSAQSEADAAAKASVFFKLSMRPAAPTSSASGNDEPVLPEARATLASDAQALDPNGQERKRAFMQAQAADTHRQAQASSGTGASRHAIRAGDTIAAALIAAINSDLPGTVTATVTENIYDSDTGRYLLIPQGATLIGRYDSEVSYGQSRVLLVWTHLVIDGQPTIPLDQLPATDASGQAGLQDRVDWHWKRIFAGAALATLVGVATELAAPSNTDGEGTVIIAARDSLHDTTNEVGQQITRRNLDVQPTLSVRAGYPLRVMVRADLLLPAFAIRNDS